MVETLSGVRVCLNMIVKNEAHVIARCLAPLKPLISHWVIVDTGSSDGTQDIIRSELAEVEGSLHERPWVNFGHNRSEAITLAAGKADYIFTIDADEILQVDAGFAWGDLTHDMYMVVKNRGARSYRIPSLVRDGLGWHWVGALHEYLDSCRAQTKSHLDGIVINSPTEGARSLDPHKYRRDALILEAALLEDPDDTRNVFYLAQSYRDCEDNELALRWYRRRARMGGWIEEVFISKLNIARILQRMGAPWPEQLAAFLDAHATLPERPEALYDLGRAYGDREDWPNAWLFLNAAMQIEINPAHVLFLEPEISLWRAKLEASVASYYLQQWQLTVQLSQQLLTQGQLPKRLMDQVLENKRLAQAKLKDAL
jgi:glycosyltransferase involved in cell wall biosynthesis